MSTYDDISYPYALHDEMKRCSHALDDIRTFVTAAIMPALAFTNRGMAQQLLDLLERLDTSQRCLFIAARIANKEPCDSTELLEDILTLLASMALVANNRDSNTGIPSKFHDTPDRLRVSISNHVIGEAFVNNIATLHRTCLEGTGRSLSYYLDPDLAENFQRKFVECLEGVQNAMQRHGSHSHVSDSEGGDDSSLSGPLSELLKNLRKASNSRRSGETLSE